MKTLIGLLLVLPLISYVSQVPQAHAQATTRHPHAAVHTHVTAADSSQTGIASFQGNFTTITAPDGEALVLARETNCALTLATASFSISSGISYTPTGLMTNYERTLHAEAGLKTMPDVFASGCAAPTTGIGSREGFYVGTTTSGVGVFAAIGYYPVGMNNALYTLVGTDPSSYALHESVIPSASTLTAADLNGDGNGDVVLSNSIGTSNGSIYVLLGNADGSFQTAAQYPAAGTGTVAAVIDDVNGDGKLDIVAVSAVDSNYDPQQISVLLGNGDGTFQSAQNFTLPALSGYTSQASTAITNLITADVRGVGKKDLILSNGLLLLGNGDGTFTTAAAPAFPYSFDYVSANGPYLASGDLNNDGKSDLVVSNQNGVTIYLGKGDGTFLTGNTYASINTDGYITISDLDGDGNNDIYVGLANGGIFEGGDYDDANLSYALMGNGDGTFSGAPVAGGYDGTNLGDVNGDGLPDLVVQGTNANNTGNLTFTVEVATKKGLFNPTSTISVPASFALGGNTINGSNLVIATYAVGDLNGDGKADLAFLTNGADLSTYSGLIYWTALSNGDGTFAVPIPHLLPSIAPAGDIDSSSVAVSALQLADVNGDGKADLLFTFNEAGGSPTGPFTYATVFLDGFTVLPGNGDGTFGNAISTYTYNSATPVPTLTSPPELVNIVDLNNDGKLDVLAVSLTGVYNSAGNVETKLQVFLGNGDGTFAAPTTANTAYSITVPVQGPGSSPCVLADFNKDGKLDVACPGADANGNSELAISLGNGDGTFGTPSALELTGGVAFNQGGIESGIAAADFNGDGNIDIALFVFNSVSGILYGNGDGTFTSVNTGNGIVPRDLINIAVGGTSIAADFNGDGKPDILTGNALLINAYGSVTTAPTLASTTTALTASASTVTAGASVTFTATITGASGSTGSPSGMVTFLNGTATLGTGTLASGVATYTTTALPTGSDSITAVYGGDTNFSGSTSSALVITVNAAPVVAGTTTTLSASASTAVSGTSLTFSAVVAPASGAAIPAGTVTFLDGTTTLGTGTLDSTGAAAYSTSSLAVGSHTITASYGGATTFSPSTSGAVTVTITSPVAVSPDFALSLSTASATISSGAVTSTISVTPSGGFNSTVTLTCSGAPAHATCAISPASVTPSGTTAATATLTITTDVKTAALNQPPVPGSTNSSHQNLALAFLGGGVLLGFTLLRSRHRNWWRVQLALTLALLAASAVAGCGSTSNATPSGTYTITVTGTSGSTTHTAVYALSVR